MRIKDQFTNFQWLWIKSGDMDLSKSLFENPPKNYSKKNDDWCLQKQLVWGASIIKEKVVSFW